MTLPLILFLIGVTLSAFFSGSETGYYRLPRVRLVIDAVGGDRIARGLLWASNNPAAFVATALVGNNVANYLASSAVVLAAATLYPAGGLTAELLLTLLATPLVFIYGELLPKRIFFDAPYRLLRFCTPAFSIAAVLFAPISMILWGASRGLSYLTGTSAEPLRMTLRRRELEGVFDEGHAVGILSPTQRGLAQATFSLGGHPIRDYMVPIHRQPRLATGCNYESVLRLARSVQQDALPIEPSKGSNGPHAMVRASRCLTQAKGEPVPTEPIPEFEESAPFLHVITQLESSAQPLGVLRDPAGHFTGYVRLARLQRTLLDEA